MADLDPYVSAGLDCPIAQVLAVASDSERDWLEMVLPKSSGHSAKEIASALEADFLQRTKRPRIHYRSVSHHRRGDCRCAQ